MDLGEHRFKDVAERIRVFQAVSADLTSTFPPIRSQGTPGSLPKPLGPTVGRETELAELRTMVLEEQRRIVTLTGPGGTGKTRLATALAASVAEQFTDGVYLVPLQAATAADHVWTAMAQVLEIPPDGHIPPGFFGYVADRTTLVVLDNLEQVPDADEVVDVLLREAQHLTIVATSRRPLHVGGEVEYAVSPLSVPSVASSVEEIGQAAAVQMFVEHASRVRKGFRLAADNAVDVARLCESLDGLPLAIELAAARAKLLAPKAILARIDQSLDLASAERGRDERQRTIRAAIAWSYDLLEPAQQVVLDRLGIFESGASFEAVEAVVPSEALVGADVADVLFELVDASLITVTDTEDGEPRFGLLQMIKRFALDRLAATGALDDAMAAHAQFFYDLARGPLFEQFDHSYRSGRDQFLRELDNLRAVVERSAPGVHDEPYGDEPVPPLHVARLLVTLAHRYRRYSDGLAWCDTSLASPAAAQDHLGRAALHAMRARLHRALGDLPATLTEVAGARRRWRASRPTVTHPPTPGRPGGVPRSSSATTPATRTASSATTTRLAPRPTGSGRSATMTSGWSSPWSSRSWWPTTRRTSSGPEPWWPSTRRSRATPRATRAPASTTSPTWTSRKASPERRRRGCSQAAEEIIAVGDPDTLIIAALTFGAAIGDLDPLLCAQVYGCAHHASVVEGIPNDEYGEAEDKVVMDRVRALTDGEAFDRAYESGAGEDLVELVRRMAALPVPDE